jgi:hypothetical protein
MSISGWLKTSISLISDSSLDKAELAGVMADITGGGR